uniref:Uncharacterized protein n=1 Tax=Cacopsylla melanoneura TaxID=428564 RepID=A0A8D8ZE80_9HEMI
MLETKDRIESNNTIRSNSISILLITSSLFFFTIPHRKRLVCFHCQLDSNGIIYVKELQAKDKEIIIFPRVIGLITELSIDSRLVRANRWKCTICFPSTQKQRTNWH